MVGLNLRLRKEHHRKWEELLQLTEPRLERIAASVRAGTLSLLLATLFKEIVCFYFTLFWT